MKTQDPKFVNDSWECRREVELHVKEKHCIVAQDFDAELKQAQDNVHGSLKEVDLPNGGKLMLRDEHIKTPDVLFHPFFINKKEESVAR